MLSVMPRTDDQILAGEGTKVELGERSYTLYPKKGLKWGREFRAKIGPLLENVQGLGAVVAKQVKPGTHDLSENEWESIVQIFTQLSGPKLDELLDMVYWWSDEVEEARDYIDDNATQPQMLDAFIVIVGFVYGPFVTYLKNRAGISVSKEAAESEESGESETS